MPRVVHSYFQCGIWWKTRESLNKLLICVLPSMHSAKRNFWSFWVVRWMVSFSISKFTDKYFWWTNLFGSVILLFPCFIYINRPFLSWSYKNRTIFESRTRRWEQLSLNSSYFKSLKKRVNIVRFETGSCLQTADTLTTELTTERWYLYKRCTSILLCTYIVTWLKYRKA